ncbi:MAG TPA: hypothetical protein DDW87_11160 [Firmicutes bacterium]|nr:hypothetical protein [Bacillota bacterium]
MMGCAGEPVSIYRKPTVETSLEPLSLVTDDNFEKPELGLQWQWNHNPVDTHWSLTERPGYLRLRAMPAPDIARARNTLTQKLIGGRGVVTAEFDLAHMTEGQLAGLTFLGGAVSANYIAIRKNASGAFLEAVTTDVVSHGPNLDGHTIWLRAEYDFTGPTYLFFSFDGTHFWPLGGECELRFGYWKGARVGLFAFQTSGKSGIIDLGSFRYVHDGPPYRGGDSR